MSQIRPQQIRKALENGPLTYGLLILSIGWDVAPSPPKRTRWQRFFMTYQEEAREQNAAQAGKVFADTLEDMCQVGMIVNLHPEKRSAGPYALPDRCPTCHGAGTQAPGGTP